MPLFNLTNVVKSAQYSMRARTRIFAPLQPPYAGLLQTRRISSRTSSRATLRIKNGPDFHGDSFGADVSVSGEMVFTTSLVGYPEAMTDPSYRGQLLVFTQPLIGNYGVPSAARDHHGLLRHFESPHLQAAGIVVADAAIKYSHWTAVESLSEWCTREGVPAVTGVDTRAIVTFLREKGCSLARLTIGEEYDTNEDDAFVDSDGINLVARVSTKSPFHIRSSTGDLHIAVLDCGIKENILRSLVSRGASVTAFPYDFPIQRVASHFDGLFLSNGPGDPTHLHSTVQNLQKFMDRSQMPIMGVCLGHQLLALAAGAKTIKLAYGNRAHNIPVLDLNTGRAVITSQNHGYAVDASTLPNDWKEFQVNLNDGSNEGLMHKARPILGVQHHPEAKGGPLDSGYLFDTYIEAIRQYKRERTMYQPPQDHHPPPLLGDMLGNERVNVHPSMATT